jgi:protein-arginine kinase activator protein McsA
MGKVRIIVLLAVILITGRASAYYKLVIDPWTTAAVTANAASQELIESQHNTRLDSISSKQQKIMQYTATMATIKELYKLSMENVSGFGEESKYYVEIGTCVAEIFKDVPVVLNYMGKSPGKNYVICLNEIMDIVLETESLVKDFVDIVNNGKLGCADCYTTFYDKLLPSLQRIHGKTRHEGKVPLIRNASVETPKVDKIEILSEELKKAIENQEFEKAAELRDEINKMKEGGNNE